MKDEGGRMKDEGGNLEIGNLEKAYFSSFVLLTLAIY